MIRCSVCGQIIIFVSRKNKIEDDMILCNSCLKLYKNFPQEFNTTEKRTKQVALRASKLYRYNKEKITLQEKLNLTIYTPSNLSFLEPNLNKKDNRYRKCFICLKNMVGKKYYFEHETFIICKECIEEVEKLANDIDRNIDKFKDKYLDKEKKVIIRNLLRKYLSNKNTEFKGLILLCYINKDIYYLFIDPLDSVCGYFKNLLIDNKSLHNLTSYEIDNLIEAKRVNENITIFIHDIEKIHKILIKKDININYLDILSFFAEIIEDDLNKEYDKILIPAYNRVSKRLGKNITTENVVKEFMKIPLELDIEPNFTIISKLLDKFNLKYDKEEVEKVIEEVREYIGLEEFEQDLCSSQKIDIGNFEKLTGYEFEGYLKGLFNLLGYTVLETPLSGDQGADLIISKDGEKTVVQAKKYNKKVSNKAIQEIVAAKSHYKANKTIVVTNSSFTKSAIDLALSNNVELWDGLKLKNTIKNLKSKKKKKGLQSENTLTLKKGEDIQKLRIICPFCEEKFDYEADIRKGVNFETECPHCGSILRANTKLIKCEYCFEQFDTIAEAEKHEITCKKRKK